MHSQSMHVIRYTYVRARCELQIVLGCFYHPNVHAGSDFPSLRSLSLDAIADHFGQLSGCLQQQLSPAQEEEVREHARKKGYYPVLPIRSRPLIGKEDGSDSTQFLFGVGYGWAIPRIPVLQ